MILYKFPSPQSPPASGRGGESGTPRSWMGRESGTPQVEGKIRMKGKRKISSQMLCMRGNNRPTIA